MAVLAIDFGSSKFCAAAVIKNQVEIIYNTNGERATPTYISFSKNDKFVGMESKRNVNSSAYKTLHRFKSSFGRYDEEGKAGNDGESFPISFEYKSNNLEIYQENLLALLIAQQKKEAEEYLEESIKECVLTVPAHFTNEQRKAVKEAIDITGLDTVAILNDTTAVCVNYVYSKSHEFSHSILVCDIGACSTSMSIFQIYQDRADLLAVDGIELGGNWIDDQIFDHFKKETDHFTLANAEQLKRYPPKERRKSIYLGMSTDGKNERASMEEDQYYKMLSPFLRKIQDLLHRIFSNVNIEKDEITDVVLNGGTTKIRLVRNLFTHFFPQVRLVTDMSQDTAVAEGAALYGALLQKSIDWNFDVTDSIKYDSKNGHPHFLPVPRDGSEMAIAGINIHIDCFGIINGGEKSVRFEKLKKLHKFFTRDDQIRESKEKAMCDLESVCLKTLSKLRKERTQCDVFLDSIRKEIIDACDKSLLSLEDYPLECEDNYIRRMLNIEYLLNAYTETCEERHASSALKSNIVKSGNDKRAEISNDSIETFIIDRTKDRPSVSNSGKITAEAIEEAAADLEEAAAEVEEAAAEVEEAAAEVEEANEEFEEVSAVFKKTDLEDTLQNWEMPEDVSVDEEWIIV